MKFFLRRKHYFNFELKIDRATYENEEERECHSSSLHCAIVLKYA